MSWPRNYVVTPFAGGMSFSIEEYAANLQETDERIAHLERLVRELARWLDIDGSRYEIDGVPPEMLHEGMSPEDWVAAAEEVTP